MLECKRDSVSLTLERTRWSVDFDAGSEKSKPDEDVNMICAILLFSEALQAGQYPHQWGGTVNEAVADMS